MTEREIIKRAIEIKKERRVVRDAARVQRQVRLMRSRPVTPSRRRLRLLNHYARDIDPHVEDGSVDAIITDPPYSPRIHRLLPRPSGVGAEGAEAGWAPARHGRPAQHARDHRRAEPASPRIPLGAELQNGWAPASIVKAKVWTNWKPILWFTNGPSDWDYVSDDVNSSGRDRTLHEWQQNAHGFVHLVERFTVPGRWCSTRSAEAARPERPAFRLAGCSSDRIVTPLPSPCQRNA